MVRISLFVSLISAVVLAFWFNYVSQGGLGKHESPGIVTEQARPASVTTARGVDIAKAADALLVARPKQILFGDLHVHTTFSFDAFMISLPLQGGEGAHPPADACDYARFCSALDFWSINDHAESISPRHWSETVDTIRACNEVAGADEAGQADTVAFLGWEWTQVGWTPDTHYGHKNVILRDLEEGQIPTRPIGAKGTRETMVGANPFEGVAAGAFLHGLGEDRMHDLARFFGERADLKTCPLGVPVRDLPLDCVEMVETPDLLFDKLNDWDVASIVIPHGTTWGFYTPPGADWAKQLIGPMHDEKRQTLFEIYSGHGNSEEYREFRGVALSAGVATCPEPSDGYLPTCWQAGELIRERCLAESEMEDECESRAIVARQDAADAGAQAFLAVPGSQAPDWLDAGQCTDCAEPSFNYRPAGSAQYVTALSNFDTEDGEPRRFRFGFLASSDNHFARPGTGYKETNRVGFTDSRASLSDTSSALASVVLAPEQDPVARSQPFDRETSELAGFATMEMERQASFFVTGGLTAAHSVDRSRDSIWESFERREIYGTSGPRMLLWFDLINPPGTRGQPIPMGGEVVTQDAPIFQVRAVGSFEQDPGCPDYAANAIGPDRLQSICKGECYNPSPTRRPITRIDVVRIRPQNAPGEPIAPLIEDPWQSFECDGSPEGCSVTFSDPEYAKLGRDTVYYVRAHEAPTQGINTGGVRCERDAEGACLEVNLCTGGPDDNCLSQHEPRAWSSPIFVDWPRS